MADPKKPVTPHRIVNLDQLIPERPEWETERPRKRSPVQVTPGVFAEYAMIFNMEWPPGRSIDYLRFSTSQAASVTVVLNRSTELLNKMVGATLGVDDWLTADQVILGLKRYRVEPSIVLRYIVRHWRVFRGHIPPIRMHETPLPDAVTHLCRTAPGDMDNILLGLFGRRIQDHFVQWSQKLQQEQHGADPSKRAWINEQYQLMFDAKKRLVKQVPWLQDGDFLDALSGEQIGQRKQTMH